MTAMAALSPESAEKVREVIESMIHALARHVRMPVAARVHVTVREDASIDVEWELEVQLESQTAGEALAAVLRAADALRGSGLDTRIHTIENRTALGLRARLPPRPVLPVLLVYNELVYAPLFLVACAHEAQQRP
jgi:hypothetical protein